MFFKGYTWQNSPHQPNASSFFSNLTQLAHNSMRLLLTIALTLIGLAVFVLVFPMVLAVVVAAFMLVAAIFCMGLIWKIYILRKNHNSSVHRVNVTVHCPQDDIFDEPL